jgi:hypothetical protein
MWKIKKIVKKGDYLYAVVRGHPRATKHGYVLLHRVVMENELGRILEPHEVVHHKDENNKNNAPDNLEVHTHASHGSHHAKRGRTLITLTCPTCREVFVRERRQTHLVKGGVTTYCSRKCNARKGKSNPR